MAKIMCYAPLGGTANLRAIDDQSVLGGAANLSGLEMEQYRRAKLMAAAVNGGDLTKAKEFLEAAGWIVYWDGPASKAANDDKWDLRLPTDLKAWAQENGGQGLVRSLLQAARERQEAGQSTGE